jgi:hypothetical protein
LRQKIFDPKIPLAIATLFLLLPLFSNAETDTKQRVVNGEEVYEPKKEETKTNEQSQNKKEVPKEKPPIKDKETKNKMGEGKAKDAPEAKTPMQGENPHEEKTMESKKNMDNGSSEGMDKYKANKIVTSDEEDPYEIHKPVGIFWFFAVFVILLIVIFVFT